MEKYNIPIERTVFEPKNRSYDKLLMWGTGGHSKVVYDHLPMNYKWNKDSIHYLDDNSIEYQNGSWKDIYPAIDYKVFVAIGNNECREQVYQRLLSSGYDMISVISPFAYISSSAKIGKCVFIAPMVCIQAETHIGNGAIINTGATVDHNCFIEDFVHIAPGVHLCGSIHIGYQTLIGVGTSIIPNIQISSGCIVAGGSSVASCLHIVNAMYAGNPAVLKKRL